MTHEQIDALLYTDLIDLLQSRLFVKNNIEPVDTLYFSEEELNAELEIYKAELRVEEDERLRVEDLKTRFNSLVDMRAAFHSIHSEPNPALWFKNLLEADPVEAESKMSALEAKDVELRPTAEEVSKKEWEKNLRADLAQNKLTTDGLLEAVVRKVILDDPTLADAIKNKLIEVNTRNPRP